MAITAPPTKFLTVPPGAVQTIILFGPYYLLTVAICRRKIVAVSLGVVMCLGRSAECV